MYRKALLVVVLAAAAGWFAWWWIAAGMQERAIAGWLEERRAAGWQAEAADLRVAGFPNRLDATLTDIALADPVSGWAWTAPRFEIFQLVYDPSRVIVAWPEEQRVAAPGARATVRAETMRASAAFADDGPLAVERSSLEILRGAVAADAGWTAGVDRYVQHLRRAENARNPGQDYEFRVDAERLRPPDFVKRVVDPAGALPPAIGLVALEGRVALDRPLDLDALEGRKPQVAALSLKEARFEWGDLGLSVTGAAEADESGYAAGEFELSARNWEEMLDAAVATGAMTRTLADTLKTGLGFMARLDGDAKALTATLRFSGGYARLGPVPIGPAPRMLR